MISMLTSADIGIIGGADGPTAIFVARSAFPWLLPAGVFLLLIAAYLCMCHAAGKKAHSVIELPDGYREIYTVDLRHNKKLMLRLNGLSIAVTLAMVIPMCFVVPISTLFSTEQGIGPYLLRFVAYGVGLLMYVILHELTHAAVMRIYGAKKLRFGFAAGCAFAGSEQDYFDYFSYVQVALSPLIVLGLILAVLNLILPIEWFWVIFLLQVTNVSGAMGDLFVSFRFSKMPRDILIKDTGMAMTVYSRQ